MISRYREPDIRPVAVPHKQVQIGSQVRLKAGSHIGALGVVLAVRRDGTRALIEYVGDAAEKVQFWAPTSDCEVVVYEDMSFRRKRIPRSAPANRR